MIIKMGKPDYRSLTKAQLLKQIEVTEILADVTVKDAQDYLQHLSRLRPTDHRDDLKNAYELRIRTIYLVIQGLRCDPNDEYQRMWVEIAEQRLKEFEKADDSSKSRTL